MNARNFKKEVGGAAAAASRSSSRKAESGVNGVIFTDLSQGFDVVISKADFGCVCEGHTMALRQMRRVTLKFPLWEI